MMTRVTQFLWPERYQAPIEVPVTDAQEKREVELRLMRLEQRLDVLQEEVRVISRTTEREP